MHFHNVITHCLMSDLELHCPELCRPGTDLEIFQKEDRSENRPCYMNGIFVLHQFIKFDIGNYLKNIKTAPRILGL